MKKYELDKDVITRLEEMIDNLITRIAPNDINYLIFANSLMSTVNTLYCLGIITKNKADEYLKKLYRDDENDKS